MQFGPTLIWRNGIQPLHQLTDSALMSPLCHVWKFSIELQIRDFALQVPGKEEHSQHTKVEAKK